MNISKENYSLMLVRARKYIIDRPLEENLFDDDMGFVHICEQSFMKQETLNDTACGFYIDDQDYQKLMVLASHEKANGEQA